MLAVNAAARLEANEFEDRELLWAAGGVDIWWAAAELAVLLACGKKEAAIAAICWAVREDRGELECACWCCSPDRAPSEPKLAASAAANAAVVAAELLEPKRL